jgi:hypothetical protein
MHARAVVRPNARTRPMAQHHPHRVNSPRPPRLIRSGRCSDALAVFRWPELVRVPRPVGVKSKREHANSRR